MNVDGAPGQQSGQQKQEQTNQQIIAEVECWLNTCVLGLSLCPYARIPMQTGAVRLEVLRSEEALTESLLEEIKRLQESEIETTLLIMRSGFEQFLDFNDCVGNLEDLLAHVGLDDEFQLVGFHPAYRFAGEAPNDPGNYTNRSPRPVFQILRAKSVAKAADDGDPYSIPQRNINTLRSLGTKQLRSLFPWV